MAACNYKEGSMAKRAITAALVGVLSVGTVPMVALATGTDAVEASDSIQTFAASEADSFSNGSIISASGIRISRGAGYVQATGNPISVKALTVKTDTGRTVEIASPNYVSSIVTADEEGNPTEETLPTVTDPGAYFLKVEAVGGQYEGGVAYLPFFVQSQKLGKLFAFDPNPNNAADTRDRDFTFTGSELNVGIMDSSRSVLEEGVDYSIKFLPSSSSIDDEGIEVVNAGKYYAVVTGLGKYAGQSATVTEFTVDPFDLDKATVSVDPVIATNDYPENPTSVTITDRFGKTTSLDPTLVKLELNHGVFGEPGRYTFTAVEAETTDNISGRKSGVTVEKYADYATTEYDDAEFPESFTTNLSSTRPQYFDVSEIKAYDADGKKISARDVDVQITDQNGYNAEHGYGWFGRTPWYRHAGTYTVKVTVTDRYDAAATATCTVRVTNGVIDADATMYVEYEGKVITSLETEYTPEGISTDAFSVIVKDADGKLLKQDKDYSVSFTDADGKAVKKFTDAGTYYITVTGITYDIEGENTVPVTISPKSFSGLTAGALESTEFKAVGANYRYLPWKQDGYRVEHLNLIYGNPVDCFDTSLYKITILKDGQEVKTVTDEGVYTLHFEPASDAVAKNYATPADFTFTCAKKSHTLFTDVTWADYFADAVATVKDKGFLNGYNGTDLFGSRDRLTRGQVACLLYNMAQGGGFVADEGESNPWKDYTSFTDVATDQYYAKAIAWAKSAGVVNGYPDGTFKPEAPVTREEFAAMLANYVQKLDSSYVAADVTNLDEFADGSQVSDWAKEVVAWAVENDIMGNGGAIMPTANIIRADAACMVYNYAFAN